MTTTARDQIARALALRDMQDREGDAFNQPARLVGPEDGDVSTGDMAAAYQASQPRFPAVANFLKSFSPRTPLNSSRSFDDTMRGLSIDRDGNFGKPQGVELPPGALADDLGRLGKSFAAGATDPLNIPSAIAGRVSPETRDAWRAAQRDVPTLSMTGNMISSGAVLAPLATASLPVAIASGAMAMQLPISSTARRIAARH